MTESANTPNQAKRGARFIDRTGQTYGRLTVLRFAGIDLRSGQKKSNWLCRCECGREKIIHGGNLNKGHIRSCGCLKQTHGMSKTSIYNVLIGIIDRCTNPKNPQFKDYGGRGIRVSSRWDHPSKLLQFVSDMGERPSPDHTVERINNNGNYEPGNVKWATRLEQNGNRRDNMFVTISGVTCHVAEMARRHGKKPVTVFTRIRRGWNAVDAILSPVGERRAVQ